MYTAEDLKIFNKILYLLHCSLVDIRSEINKDSNCDIKKVEVIADIFEVMPLYIFEWKMWNNCDDTPFIDFIISKIEFYMKQYYIRGRDYIQTLHNYIEILQMDYHEFVKKNLNFTLKDDEPITFPQTSFQSHTHKSRIMGKPYMNTAEDLKLYNKILYLLHRALVDIRSEARKCSICDIKKIEDIADIFEAMPMYIFMSKDTSWIDAFIYEINFRMKQHHTSSHNFRQILKNYMEILQMDYHDFVEKHLKHTLKDDEPIAFPQTSYYSYLKDRFEC